MDESKIEAGLLLQSLALLQQFHTICSQNELLDLAAGCFGIVIDPEDVFGHCSQISHTAPNDFAAVQLA